MIKEAALAAGADACGIGSMDRFDGAPREMDPRYLFPEAKSVIGFVFRIPRGVQRGIEDGTHGLLYAKHSDEIKQSIDHFIGEYINNQQQLVVK